MSTRSKRSTRTRDSSQNIESSADETMGSSPTNSATNFNVSSRQEEKNQLSNLNDRLATYIDKVRSLETENNRLHIQLRDVEVIEKKEKENLSHHYESKIDELRKHVDDLTREKAKLQIETDTTRNLYHEMKPKLNKIEKELKKTESERKANSAKVQELTALFNNADSARISAEKENAELRHETNNMDKQINSLRRQLEDEVVIRTEFQNRLKSSMEDLEFARRSHDSQIEEFRRKRQVEMTTYSNEVESKFQSRLQEHVQELRSDFDTRIAKSRAEIEEMYKNKLAEANENANRSRSAAVAEVETAAQLRSRNRELETAIQQKESEKNTLVENLNRRVQELEASIRHLRDESDIRLRQRDEQIAQLQKEISSMIGEYQDLLDIKIQLDNELQTYHKLLEGEESRLHITPSPSPNSSMNVSSGHHVSFADMVSGSGCPRRGIKRKRMDRDFITFDQTTQEFKINNYAAGDIEIDEVDAGGQFIRLINKGDNDISIASWNLNCITDEKEVSLKFSSRQTIKSKKTITIWSSNAVAESGALNMVMKNQIWPDNPSRVELKNNESLIVARYEVDYQHGSHYSEMGSDPNQRCSVM